MSCVRFLIMIALLTVSPAQPAMGAGSSDVLYPVDVRAVTVGGEIGRRIDVTVRNNLLVLELDEDFLLPFKKREETGGYIGVGKLLDSMVGFAAHTGNEELLKRKKHVVKELLATQEADGYIGLMKPDSRMWQLWDIHEMAYLIQGLTADYRFFKEEASLAAACKLADYVVTRWSAEPTKEPGEGSITVHMAVTGLETALLALHRATGKAHYRQACIALRKLPAWDPPIVLGRWGQIAGHAYAHMCRCVAQLRLHRLAADARLLKPARAVMAFLTRQNGLVVTGTCGDHECWHDTQEGTINLGETCATAYLLRLLDELFRMEGTPLYGDLMERAIFNALFAAQSPDGRRIRYYSPFEGPRAYFSGDTYCCPCNYRRIVAELPGFLYYRTKSGGVAVNLYAASTAKVPLAGSLTVTITQETDYPTSGDILLRVEPSQPRRFPLRLRVPRWCGAATVVVNGKPVGGRVTPGSFFTIDRKWQSGDRVALTLPMKARLVKGRVNQAGRVAMMHGPLVLCLNRARNGALADTDLRLLTIDPATVEGPLKGTTFRPDGVSYRVKAWGPGKWYPMAKHDLTLTLTEFPDPGGEAVYFKVPNPLDDRLVDDELVR